MAEAIAAYNQLRSAGDDPLAQTMLAVGKALALRGDAHGFQSMLARAQRVASMSGDASALQAVALAQTEDRQFAEALRTAQAIRSPKGRALALIAISDRLPPHTP